MSRGQSRDLYLNVSGNVTGLAQAMKQGRSLLLDFGSETTDVLAAVDRKFAEIGKGGAPGLKEVERAYDATFRRIRENAQAVANAPDGTAALRAVDANGARDAAANADRLAAYYRAVAEAADRADKAQNGNNQAVRAFAVAAATQSNLAAENARAYREQAAALGLIEAQLDSTGVAQRRQVAISGQTRAGFQQLGFQLNDVAVQYAAGTSASIIFAQQSGQVIQAIQLISGEAKGLIGFLGGPWGIALSTALVALTPFVAKILEGGDALDKETRSLIDNAAKAEIADQAKANFAKTEAGLADGVRKLTEELDKQNQSLKTNAELQNIRAKQLVAGFGIVRGQIGDQLSEARAQLRIAEGSSPGLGSDGELDRQRAIEEAAAKVTALEIRLREADQFARTAETNLQRTRADLAAEAAKRSGDEVAQITRRYDGPDGLVEQAKRRALAEGTVTAALTRQLTTLERQKKAEIDAAEARKRAADQRASSTANRQFGREIDVDEARAIVAGIGGRVTSGLRSTERQAELYQAKLDGRHIGPVAKPGTSAHERGQAIDVAYGPGITVASIRQAFAEAGVSLRKILNEPTQRVFHVEFGKAGPRGPSAETLQRREEAAEQKRVRDEEAFLSLKATAEQRLLDSTRSRVTSIEQAAAIDLESVRIERQRLDEAAQAGVLQDKWTQAKADELKALNLGNAAMQAAAIRDREREQVAARTLETEAIAGRAQAELLGLQMDQAVTLKERRAIALQLLELDQQERRARLQAQKDMETDPSRRVVLANDLAKLGGRETLERQGLEQQYAGPFERAKGELQRNVGDIDEALEGVGARALGGLEEGLLDVISGTESVAGAFKKMANAIIADIARIVIQKLILNAISGNSLFGGLFADGGKVPGFAAGGIPGFAFGGLPFVDQSGLINGPGTGTSDSILALIGGRRPIRVSAGEGIVNARGVRKHWGVVDAINKDRLPEYLRETGIPMFAAGGLPIGVPRMPSVSRAQQQLAEGRRDRIQLDGEISIQPTAEFDARMERVSARTVGDAAGPLMAGAKSQTLRELRRRKLPGAPG